MNELPPDAKDFLQLASSVGRDAPEGAAERVKERLALTLAGAAALEAGRRAAEGGQSAAHATTLAPALKLAVVAACAAGLGTVGWIWSGRTDPADASESKRNTAPHASPAESIVAPPPPLAATAAEPAANAAERGSEAATPVATTPLQPPASAMASLDDAALRGELELLKAASNALERNDIARARRLLRLHRAQFPRGTLLNERRGLQVLASCLESEPQAQARAEAFLHETSHGFVSARIRVACHLEPTE